MAKRKKAPKKFEPKPSTLASHHGYIARLVGHFRLDHDGTLEGKFNVAQDWLDKLCNETEG